MNLVRLERHQHPRSADRELRHTNVFDSHGQFIGEVANLYVDDDRELHFVDVVTSGFLGLAKRHYLVPVEAIIDESPGIITLGIDHQTIAGAPTFPNPLAGPDEELQRSTREHYGYGYIAPP